MSCRTTEGQEMVPPKTWPPKSKSDPTVFCAGARSIVPRMRAGKDLD